MSASTSFAPSAANRSAVPRPMPRPPPVMIATLSFSSMPLLLVRCPVSPRSLPPDGGACKQVRSRLFLTRDRPTPTLISNR